MRAAFRIEVKRKQRRSDGTVSLDGQRFEIPSRYRHLDQIHLRYARWDLSGVDLIEARSGQVLCPVRPLDKAANAEALYVPPKVENFCWRIEQAHLREGGFALIHGDAGSGKSVVMRLLAERLARLADLSVGVIHHPQSNLSDFYRELGDIFSISIRVSNRWGGFKALRARFDSQSLLCVVLSGDARLLDKLRREELIPLGSRIRTRLATGVATREELLACLEHLLTTAGNASLMTKQLRNTLCDHVAGNYRVFIGMAAEILMTAAQREITELDEKLYLQVFAPPETQTPRRLGAR